MRGFNNGEVAFYVNGWKIIIQLYLLEASDIQEIHDAIFRTGNINWEAFEWNDEFWYADGSKSVRCTRKNNDTYTIWFE